MQLTRLPQRRIEAMRTSLHAWHDIDRDLGALFDAEREAFGHYPMSGGTDDLGYVDLVKTWDGLHFLLDPARRGGEQEPTTPGGAAVRGWHSMPEFYGEQFDYVPRFNSASEVAEIAQSLRATDFGVAIEAHGDTLLSPPSHVYGWGGGRPLATRKLHGLAGAFERVWTFYEKAERRSLAERQLRGYAGVFERMRAFYERASRRDQAVLLYLS